MPQDVWLMFVLLTMNGGLMVGAPSFSRRDILFSVTVGEPFRLTSLARATTLHYRLLVIAGTLVAAAVVVAAESPRARIIGPLVQVAAAAGAWAWAHRRTLPHAAAVPATREVSLVARDTRLPGGPLAAIGPFVILGAAALYLYLNWDLIPDRFPHHWNANGVPDRWSVKAVGSVYSTLAMGVAIVALTLAQGVFVLRRTRQVAASGEAAVSEQSYKRGTARYTTATTYVMALLFSYFATRKLSGTDAQLGWEIWVLLGVIIAMSLSVTVWMIRIGQGGQRRVGAAARVAVPGDATSDSAWKAGLVYFNPADPALFVERRSGLGWTLNFGNALSWVFMALALLGPFLIMRFMS